MPLFYNNEALYIVGIVWKTLNYGDRVAQFWMVLVAYIMKTKMCNTVNIKQMFA
jgi:hypothetical protein